MTAVLRFGVLGTGFSTMPFGPDLSVIGRTATRPRTALHVERRGPVMQLSDNHALIESAHCILLGLDPTDLLPSIEADPSETRERWLEHPLGLLRHVLVEPLQMLAEESNSVVQVTDPSGLTLYLGGPEWLKARAAEMNLVEGARCSETVNGTNGVGTALAADHPVQVFAFEHFSHHHREWVCSGAPIHDPVSGRLVGVIDLTSPWKIAHPRSLELVTTAARTTEQCLLEERRDQDARLRRRYGDLAAKSTDLLVNREGHLLVGGQAPDWGTWSRVRPRSARRKAISPTTSRKRSSVSG